ncbi:Ig-like domain-containing protein [Streptomyces prunicolor]|uniref:Ig-like domain-containing protein n=1 Tax=Streptomyces prunicolor TaxID=67348 RepID=A0ABU4FU87_9ACTN|nr:Ig-like domain-containing protein [Streptomyces prunicolor]MDV7223491.1 Ig-like domain-containing protein [Streptomyces prunicolor]
MSLQILSVTPVGGSASAPFTGIQVVFEVSGCEIVEIDYTCGNHLNVPIVSGQLHTETLVLPNTLNCNCATSIAVYMSCSLGAPGSSKASWSGYLCCPVVTNPSATILSTSCTNGQHTVELSAQVSVAATGTLPAAAQWIWNQANPGLGGSLATSVSPGSTVAVSGTHTYAPGAYTARLLIVVPGGCLPVDVPFTVPPCCATVNLSITKSSGQAGPATEATLAAQVNPPTPTGCPLVVSSYKWVVTTSASDTWEALQQTTATSTSVSTADPIWTRVKISGVPVPQPIPNQVLPLTSAGTYTVAVSVGTAGAGGCNPVESLPFSLSGETTPPTLVGSCAFVLVGATVSAVRLTFSEPMDPATVTDPAHYALTVVPQGGSAVAATTGSASYDTTQHSVDLSGFTSGGSAYQILGGAAVTVTINGVTDVAGNPIAGSTTTSCTAPGGDTTPPRVTGCLFTTDSAGAITAVLVRFSEPVDPAAAANAANYAVTVGGSPVPAGSVSVSYDLSTITARLTGFAVPAGAQVGVVVSGIPDLHGNPIVTDGVANATSCVAPSAPPTPTPPSSGGCACVFLLVIAMLLIAVGAIAILVSACTGFLNPFLLGAGSTLLLLGATLLGLWALLCGPCPAVLLLISTFGILAASLAVLAGVVALFMPGCALGLLILAGAFATIAAALVAIARLTGCLPPSAPPPPPAVAAGAGRGQDA